MRLYFTVAEYTRFEQWAKDNNWLFISRFGKWSDTNPPRLVHWVETWLSPSGLVVRLESEAEK